MAPRMAKMIECPTCGATLSERLVKQLRTNPAEYSCPNDKRTREERAALQAELDNQSEAFMKKAEQWAEDIEKDLV